MNILNTIWHIIWPMKPIEAILTFFAIFAWSRAFLRFRGKTINQKEFAFWSLIWFGAIIIVFIPGKTTYLANVLGMGRGFDAMMFLGIVALFYAIYRLYVRVNEIEIEITELIRQIALNITVQNLKKLGKSKIK